MDEYQFQFCIPCLFGVEGLVADELRRMNIREVRAEDGRVLFSGSLADCAAVNLSLRCGERVLMEIGSFPAKSFDALFEGTRALPWENILPRDAAFPVTGYSLDSALFSVPDCQRIIKKAVVERMKARYHLDHFPESGAEYKIRFSLRKDSASLYLDTSGTALHKRGYRPAHTEAALRETLAAAMVKLARYRGKGDFCDPFCGSGTIAIEAALLPLSPRSIRVNIGFSPRTSIPGPFRLPGTTRSGPASIISSSSLSRTHAIFPVRRNAASSLRTRPTASVFLTGSRPKNYIRGSALPCPVWRTGRCMFFPLTPSLSAASAKPRTKSASSIMV